MKKLLLLLLTATMLFTTAFTATASEIHEHNPYRQVIDSLTDQERLEMEQILYLEAGSDTFWGRVATAQVMLNRVNSSEFPDDMHSVLSQKRQYSTWHKRNRARPGEAESDAITFIYQAESMTELPLDTARLFQDCKPIGKHPIKVGKQYFGY